MPKEATKIDDDILVHLKSLVLLCVDDNKDVQFTYEAIFENMFKELIFGIDGEDGYEKYLSQNVDIIITDYSMPKLNGLDMIEKIRLQDRDIPIILVTAISDNDVIIKALQLHTNNFIQKPADLNKLYDAIGDCSKLIIANNYLHEQKNSRLSALEEKEKYNSYQSDLGFKKELNILRNDFYYQMIDYDGISLVDFLYHPLDAMSGDSYSARRIDEHSTFYLMVDGMGKGISASLTTMIMTSFINHIFDKMLFLDDFDLSILVHETIEYIKPILLDEETLSIDYIVIDNKEEMIYYAKFSMPVLLMEDTNNNIVRLKSNNPPLCKWQPTFNIDSFDISNISKFLIYSDGMVENETIFDDIPYSEYVEEDFLNSFTREDLKNSFLQKITTQEDDVTLIYIHRLNKITTKISNKIFSSTLEEVDNANEWYENIWKSITDDTKLSNGAEVVFTELFINAFEHGNLGISSDAKHALINNDIYIETILEKQKECNKKIAVTIKKIKHQNSNYILTTITDEGDGFDTQILSEIFRNSQTFNGRGVFVSRKNSLGIYYNSTGNKVLYLNKV